MTMDTPHTDEDRITAIGLARYAYDYLYASMVVKTNDLTPHCSTNSTKPPVAAVLV